MKKILVIGLCLTVGTVFSRTLFVAPDGDDHALGTKKAPLASLNGARLRVRELRKLARSDSITVEFADGEYPLANPVFFEAEDSGTAEAPVVYRAAQAAKPCFSGGMRLPPFVANDDGTWQTKVDKNVVFEQLYINGKRAIRARSPNNFYYYMEAPQYYGIDPLTGKTTNFESRAFLALSSEDIAPLANMNMAELHHVMATVYHSWSTSHMRLQKVDLQNKQVIFTTNAGYPLFKWQQYLPRYHLENFRAALDAPGEWFLESDGRVLYIPLEGECITNSVATIPVCQNFIRINGTQEKVVAHISFQGLSFKYSSFSLPEQGVSDSQAAVRQAAAIEVSHANAINFSDCTLAHLGEHGIWLHKNCRDCTIERCHLYDLGAGGIRIGSTDRGLINNPDQLTTHIVIDNNIIQQGGRFFQGATGVWIGHASDIQVSHNDISDFFYTGISLGWTWGYRETATHRITLSHNHIHHLGWGVLSDMGGIYTLGNSTGSVIQGNSIHHVYSYDYTGRGGWGLYTDEGSQNMIFADNLVYKTKTGSVHQHYGRNNVFCGNILANGLAGQIQRSRVEKHTTIVVTNNIIYWDNDSPAFYPIRNDSAKDTVFNHNFYWNPSGIASNAFNGLSWEAWQAGGQDKHSQIIDPCFKSPKLDDFCLQENSPALKAGFACHVAAKAGVYGTPAWRELAALHKYDDIQFAPEPPCYEIKRVEENFDQLPKGCTFPFARINIENKGDSIAVTDEQAFSGKHSLKIQDAPNLERGYYPYLSLSAQYTQGVVINSFALYMPADAHFFTEWRDYNIPDAEYAIGPLLRFNNGKMLAGTRTQQPDGTLKPELREICSIPTNKWVVIRIEGTVGAGKDNTWSITLKPAGKDEIKVSGLYMRSAKFQNHTSLVLCSTAQHATAFFIDDFLLEQSSTP